MNHRLPAIRFAFVAILALQVVDATAQMPGARRPGAGVGPGPGRQEFLVTERPELPEGWIDTHIHLRAGDGNYAAALGLALSVMGRAGVSVGIVMPQPFPGDSHNPNEHEYDAFLPAVRASGGRLALLGGGGSLNGMIERAHRDGRVSPELLEAFEAQADKIARDGAAGFGELAIEHLSHFPGHPYESVPADHALFLRLADVAARHGLPIDVHMDVVSEDRPLPAEFSSPPNPRTLKANLPAFERLLAHNREARIVLAHCGWDVTGHWSTDVTRRLLATHRNLYMSIKINPRGLAEHSPLGPSGIKEDWLALLKEFPERFVIGSDSFYAVPGARGPGSQLQLAGPSALLARLPKDIAIKVGYENARRIYRLK